MNHHLGLDRDLLVREIERRSAVSQTKPSLTYWNNIAPRHPMVFSTRHERVYCAIDTHVWTSSIIQPICQDAGFVRSMSLVASSCRGFEEPLCPS